MKMLKWLAAVWLIALLGACGGGGGSAGTSSFGTGSGTTGTTGTTATSTNSLTLTLSSTTVTVAAPATITINLRDASGNAVANSVVSFSTKSGLGVFSVPSVLTDANGAGTVLLSPAPSTSAGADIVLATTTVGTTAVTASAGFQSGGNNASAAATLALTLSSTSVSTASPATITVKLRDALGNAVPNSVVQFKSTAGLGAFNVASVLTDVNGSASALLSPAAATSAGADTVVATAVVAGVTVTSSSGFQSSGSTASTLPTLALSLSSATVTAANPATVTVQLLDGTSKPVPNTVITFSTTLHLGVFNVSTALTDASGTATAVLSPAAATTAGADTVTATAALGTTTVTASGGFQLTATNVTVASFVSTLGAGQLSAYGQTGLTLTLGSVANGVPVTVSLSSTCVTAGKATLTPASVTTTNGVANFTFKDSGCGAIGTTDSIQASIGASTATAALSIALGPVNASAIKFISATPQAIYLKGSGFGETATVVFEVDDVAGHPLPNQSVTLNATTLAGGLTLDGAQAAETKVSDSNGQVSVLVNSGTVPTPVRIQASLTLPTTPATTITTVSSTLAIAVGLPSEINFSLSQHTINIEGFNIDGTTNTYNIIASDRMGNPVPDGTAINFVLEAGGSVNAIALTSGAVAGNLARASSNFISASPRPADGRITVVAYALGEESFNDVNGNNTYDVGEDFQDLGDIYIDRGYTGTYDAANDQLISLGLGGSSACHAASIARLDLDISIPSRPGSCDGVWGKAYVRRATETVLSTSSARPVWGVTRPFAAVSCGSRVTLTGDDLQQHAYYVLGTGDLAVGATNNSGAFGFYASDANGTRLNPMAAGTTITATATSGLTVTVNGGSSATVPNTPSANAVSIGYAFASGTTAGTITLNFTSPSLLVTSVPVSIAQVNGSACP